MTLRTCVLIATMFVANLALAETRSYPESRVSFQDFKTLVAEVESHRAARLVDLDTFLEMSREPGVIILDTRSTFRYDRIHIRGAKHLSFTDFTQDNLLKIIPSHDTTILIYCNNNFEGNPTDFATKAFVPPAVDAMSRQVSEQAKPIMLALNVPTYINLYGYGYRNIYELNELVDVADPRISFEGSVVGQNLEGSPPRVPAD